MKTKFTIRVTARDIKRGVMKDEDKCPVALAGSRRFKTRVRAVPSVMWWFGYWKEHRYLLPENVGQRMIRYDQGKGMKPFSFTVRL